MLPTLQSTAETTYRKDSSYIPRIRRENHTLTPNVELSRIARPIRSEGKDPVPEIENGVSTCVQYASENDVEAKREAVADPRREGAEFSDCSAFEVGDQGLVDGDAGGEEKEEEGIVCAGGIEH